MQCIISHLMSGFGALYHHGTCETVQDHPILDERLGVYVGLIYYTPNPHERSTSNGRPSCLPSAHRAATKRLPSEIAWLPLGRRSVVAHRTLGRQLAWPLLAGRWDIGLQVYHTFW